MRAVVQSERGDASTLQVGEVPDPQLTPSQVLIRVAAAGVNRADAMQRVGAYPPPAGASDVLGLEVSGEVVRVGSEVAGWRPGDRVMALIEGGGYAELAAAPATQVMPIPASLSLIEAGGIPEVFITAHDNLFTRGRLHSGDTVLVHGGAGGVGTAAIQLAKQHGCRVLATARGDARVQRCVELGADIGMDHAAQDFAEVTRDATGGAGADVILDVVGASYLARNLAALAADGRLVIIGSQGGTRAELDIALLMRRRGSVVATHLRHRPAVQKAGIVGRFVREVLPLLELRAVRPVIGAVFPLAQVADAHRALEASEQVGKIVLSVGA